MRSISVDFCNTSRFVKGYELFYMQDAVVQAAGILHQMTGQGNEFTGWLDLPARYDKTEYNRILEASKRIRHSSDMLLVIGIGGSYLGAKAAIDMLTHAFHNTVKTPQILFAGHNMSAAYMSDLMEVLEGKNISVNVISKSGTTTEPAVAFRIIKKYMEEKYGKGEASKRIYTTTDKRQGALRNLAETEGYEYFVIPDDVGGRYSVLTAVGLLPMAVAGIDIGAVMDGAHDAVTAFASGYTDNDCYKYAAMRNILYRKGKTIEIMVNYEPSMMMLTEWWKQLFGESEGKDGKGIFPAGVGFTTDLHSMGQFIQDGTRNIFETVVNIEKVGRSVIIPDDSQNIDGLNFLSGKDMDFVNKKATEGTIMAHVDGGVPIIQINIPEINGYWFGQTVYFFEKACAVSGYLMGVNPFNQPGVEAYKKNMFALLGKNA